MQKSILDLGKSIKFLKDGGKVRGVVRVGQNVAGFECDPAVAYTYFKILVERQKKLCQKKKSILLSDNNEPAPVPPLRSGAKAEASASGNTASASAIATDQEDHKHHTGKLHKPDMKRLRKSCQQYCTVIAYVLLGAVDIAVSAAVLVVTILAAVATKIFDSEQSSRLVAMIVLAVTAAISLSTTIYAMVGAVRKRRKPVHSTGIALVLLAVIQAVVIGIAIRVDRSDELAIGKSLQESFKLALADNSRHSKIWAATQYDLKCCGLYGPEDYRDPLMPFYFPPNVPISCCPSYDPGKAPYNQEKQRELCKVHGNYYQVGCREPVIEVFKETSAVVIIVVAVLIVIEIILTILGIYLNKKRKCEKEQDTIEISL